MCVCQNCGCEITVQVGEKGDTGATGATGPAGPSGGLPDVLIGTTANITLSADDTGGILYPNRSEGIVYTLPDQPAAGTNYTIEPKATAGAGPYVINAGVAGLDVIDGFVYMKVAGAPEVQYLATNATQISMNGTTTGGIIGTSFKLVYDGVDTWQVSGYMFGSGAIATPFS